MEHQIFCIKHRGESMPNGASLVVAECEKFAREMLFQYFLNKQDRGLTLQVEARNSMEVEPLEHSIAHRYPVSLEERGVRIEYQYDHFGTNFADVVYIAGGAQALAGELESLQSCENDGRGVSCVRSIVAFLQRGNLTSAKAVVWTEGDKIASYPAIENVLKRVGFVYQS